MIRKILVLLERTYVLELPESFLGKEVEVLAFEVESKLKTKPNKSLEEIEKELMGLTVNDPDFLDIIRHHPVLSSQSFTEVINGCRRKWKYYE